MHLKTVQIEFFAIEIIISTHNLCLKNVLPKCENWQKKFLILLTESQFSGTFFALYTVGGHDGVHGGHDVAGVQAPGGHQG